MTANAMQGDRERCLDSGMDDYMSKPLNRYILEKTLKKWDPLAKNKSDQSNEAASKETVSAKTVSAVEATPPKPDVVEQVEKPADIVTPEIISPVVTATTPETTIKTKPNKPEAEINQKCLSTKTLESLKEFMGDEIIQLLEMFEQETPTILRKMHKAVISNNHEEVQKMAHMLKSTSANIGGNGLSFFSRKMELAADTKQSNQMPIIFNKIKKAYILTSKEISKYIQSQ
jgi:CheY-like chemotaxis protein